MRAICTIRPPFVRSTEIYQGPCVAGPAADDIHWEPSGMPAYIGLIEGISVSDILVKASRLSGMHADCISLDIIREHTAEDTGLHPKAQKYVHLMNRSVMDTNARKGTITWVSVLEGKHHLEQPMCTITWEDGRKSNYEIARGQEMPNGWLLFPS